MVNRQMQKHVLITGGTGSVGRALVSAFISQGYNVTFQYCNNEKVAEELIRLYGVRSLQIDFTKEFDFPNMDFDVVVNNAGINITDTLTHEITLDDWNRTLRVNLTAPFMIVRSCLPFMMKKRWGRIINVSSIYGLRAVEGNFPYNVSKHALSGITKTIAKEYIAYGITCNEICPGPINSDMVRKIGAKSITKTGGSIDTYLKDVCNEIPAKRMAEPKEVANLAVFLASPEMGYLTGASIPLDGGMIA